MGSAAPKTKREVGLVDLHAEMSQSRACGVGTSRKRAPCEWQPNGRGLKGGAQNHPAPARAGPLGVLWLEGHVEMAHLTPGGCRLWTSYPESESATRTCVLPGGEALARALGILPQLLPPTWAGPRELVHWTWAPCVGSWSRFLVSSRGYLRESTDEVTTF